MRDGMDIGGGVREEREGMDIHGGVREEREMEWI